MLRVPGSKVKCRHCWGFKFWRHFVAPRNISPDFKEYTTLGLARGAKAQVHHEITRVPHLTSPTNT